MVANITRRLKRARLRTGAAIEFAWGITFGLALLGMTLFQGVLSTYDPMQSDLLNRFAAPGGEAHWLGSDNLGRDLWSRALAGLEWSLSAALIATLLAAAVGTTLGLVAAESQGRTRTVIRQLVAGVRAIENS